MGSFVDASASTLRTGISIDCLTKRILEQTEAKKYIKPPFISINWLIFGETLNGVGHGESQKVSLCEKKSKRTRFIESHHR